MSDTALVRFGPIFAVIADADSCPFCAETAGSVSTPGIGGTPDHSGATRIPAFLANNGSSRHHQSTPSPGVLVIHDRLVGDVQAGLAEAIDTMHDEILGQVPFVEQLVASPIETLGIKSQ